MKVLVTGGAGLVGTESCRFLKEQGHEPVSVDNYGRGEIFGDEGNTEANVSKVHTDLDVEHISTDFRSEQVREIVADVDAIIHTAAQPSHPKSIEIPIKDFEINAEGTLQLLEWVRETNPDIPFVFCSTNKVYGEMPNFFSYEKDGQRFEPEDPALRGGFDESLRLDQNMHTPFGVSKTAADLYVQEYAKLYDLKAASFRMGCITGGAAKAVELHNWEPFFMKKALAGEKLTIFGYEGFQVRDIIHARDIAKLFYKYIENPRGGEVYNVGGGRENSTSLLEAIDLIEEITGNTMEYEHGDQRKADHQWWISDLTKAKNHFDWDIDIGVEEIFTDIHEELRPKFGS